MGWIKVHRKILDDPVVTKDSDYFIVWTYLLLNATHANISKMFKGKKTTLMPGQLITGRKSISEKLNIDESKIQRILKAFEKDGKIIQITSNKNRLITILKWEQYQQIAEQQNNPCDVDNSNGVDVQTGDSEQQVNNKTPKSEQQDFEESPKSEQQNNQHNVVTDKDTEIDNSRNEQQVNNKNAKSEQQKAENRTQTRMINKNVYKDDDDYIGYVEKFKSITKKEYIMSSSSQQQFNAIKSEYGMTKLYKALDEVNTSEYLKANTSLDWLLQVNNFLKVINGNYRKFESIDSDVLKTKKTKFHNFKGASDKYTAQELQDIADRKRAEKTGRAGGAI